MSLREHTILFLDDTMIARQEGLTRTPQAALKHPANPIVRRSMPWEAGQVYIFGSVIQEPATGLFRMWYQAIDAGAGTAAGHMSICYAESDDGVSWRKPLLPFCPWGGRHTTNIVLGHAAFPGNPYCASVIRDDDATDPHARYKLTAWYERWTDTVSQFDGAAAFHSPDGFHWTLYPQAAPFVSVNTVPKADKVERYPGPNDVSCLSPDKRDGQYLSFQTTRRYIAEGRLIYPRDLMTLNHL